MPVRLSRPQIQLQILPDVGVSCFTDAAAAPGNLPTVILGPGKPQLAHQTDEYCQVARIVEAQEIFIEIILDWCAK
jgi:succinyl-diaminopimelate desuccinylase